MIRTGTGRRDKSNTVATVAEREDRGRGRGRGRAPHDCETYSDRTHAMDPNYSRIRTSEAEATARFEDVMAMLTHVAKVTELKAAYRHSSWGAAVATPFIIGGGLLLGRIGIFIGGTLGSFVGWMVSEDFKSVPQILMELPDAERQKLCAKAMAFVKNLDWTDAAHLIELVMSNTGIKEKVLEVLTTYITNKLKAKPKYRR